MRSPVGFAAVRSHPSSVGGAAPSVLVADRPSPAVGVLPPVVKVTRPFVFSQRHLGPVGTGVLLIFTTRTFGKHGPRAHSMTPISALSRAHAAPLQAEPQAAPRGAVAAAFVTAALESHPQVTGTDHGQEAHGDSAHGKRERTPFPWDADRVPVRLGCCVGLARSCPSSCSHCHKPGPSVSWDMRLLELKPDAGHPRGNQG